MAVKRIESNIKKVKASSWKNGKTKVITEEQVGKLLKKLDLAIRKIEFQEIKSWQKANHIKI